MTALVAVALLGCTKSEPQNCPDDVPASCPSPAPTFSADVDPLIQRYCARCHSPDGAEPTTLLVDYASITAMNDKNARDVEDQLNRCLMPPPGEPQLTSEQRQTILGWLVCGAQNN